MSQRISGYERKERDSYETPEWVSKIVPSHMRPIHGKVWEPAAGTGKMVQALKSVGLEVRGTDIASGSMIDFLAVGRIDAEAIITNPPYEHAVAFISHALELMKPNNGQVAMLLRTDFDHAKTRKCLFADCKQFTRKVVLLQRIRWIPGSDGSPSFNHAWFIWDWRNTSPPRLAYAP